MRASEVRIWVIVETVQTSNTSSPKPTSTMGSTPLSALRILSTREGWRIALISATSSGVKWGCCSKGVCCVKVRILPKLADSRRLIRLVISTQAAWSRMDAARLLFTRYEFDQNDSCWPCFLVLLAMKQAHTNI